MKNVWVTGFVVVGAGLVWGTVWEERQGPPSGGALNEGLDVKVTINGEPRRIRWAWDPRLQALVPTAVARWSDPGASGRSGGAEPLTDYKRRERESRWREGPSPEPVGGARGRLEDVGLVPPPAGSMKFSARIEVGPRRGSVMLYRTALLQHEVARWYASRMGSEWMVEPVSESTLWAQREDGVSVCLVGVHHEGVSYLGVVIQR